MLSPLKKRAMSWSEDCQGKPLALITELSHTFSILLLRTTTQANEHATMGLGATVYRFSLY